MTYEESVLCLSPSRSALKAPRTSFQREVLRQLDRYFEGRQKKFAFRLSPQATEFQFSVWKEAIQIPFGSKKTYGELARALGHPQAARAVGQAMSKNPVLILIPCHRVIAFGGAIGGFRYGRAKKERLLNLESRAR